MSPQVKGRARHRAQAASFFGDFYYGSQLEAHRNLILCISIPYMFHNGLGAIARMYIFYNNREKHIHVESGLEKMWIGLEDRNPRWHGDT